MLRCDMLGAFRWIKALESLQVAFLQSFPRLDVLVAIPVIAEETSRGAHVAC